ncbi:MAG: hypothetical protein JJ992_27020 [Planctomycetes bacterium]|nr:hypothetical protein [Planctomycetota bacterium]
MSEERRGRRTYHKLRFRTGGQQVVRYIGNAERAALVKADLQRLQAETKAVRELKTRMKLAKQMLTQAKRTLEPVLEAHGLAFQVSTHPPGIWDADRITRVMRQGSIAILEGLKQQF